MQFYIHLQFVLRITLLLVLLYIRYLKQIVGRCLNRKICTKNVIVKYSCMCIQSGFKRPTTLFCFVLIYLCLIYLDYFCIHRFFFFIIPIQYLTSQQSLIYCCNGFKVKLHVYRFSFFCQTYRYLICFYTINKYIAISIFIYIYIVHVL